MDSLRLNQLANSMIFLNILSKAETAVQKIKFFLN
jgi:hypothetical protein